ncbi:uncharacterized protein LOC129952613 [Eupeodes corollae]|uniref:uncharacterized protein LOC129952613 n=1 Tax=Eupeodes corollae TaxID=290404 RepID=UPI00248FB652|nr:uncharacterized protein LOC129952613 [Eupeodes corollae]
MSVETLCELKRARAVKKASITRISSKINKEKQTDNELACRVKMLEKYFEEYLNIQDSIDSLTTEGDVKGDDNTEQDDYRETVEDLYCEIKSKILTLTEEMIPKSSKLLPYVPSTHQFDDLPKTKPPTFSAHSNNKKVPAVGRRVFDVREANYVKALQILQERYDNKCIVFQTHIRELYNIPAVSKNSGVHLRRFVDDVDGHLAALRSPGSDTDIVNALLIYIASIKLDSESYTKWEESFDLKTLPFWTACSTFINKRSQHIDIRESQSKTTTPSLKGNEVKYKHRSIAALAVSEQRCVFCNVTTHKISNCSKFAELSVYHRFRNSKRIGLCINCLNHGHSVKDCTSSKCKVCKEPHHTLLHSFQSAPLGSKPTIDNACNADPYAPITSSALHSGRVQHSTSSYVFLATAVVNVKGVNGEFIQTRILLDSGSQLNLISEV